MICNNINAAIMHRTHVDGTFYQMPDKFPCVLHDKRGCIYLTKERYSELVRYSNIHESTGGKVSKINIRTGISQISGYETCMQRDICPKYNARKVKHQ